MAKSNKERNKIIDHLRAKHIPAMIYYRIPLHLQKVFRGLGYQKGDFPIAEKISDQIFSIPMHPYLDQNQQDKILEALHTIA